MPNRYHFSCSFNTAHCLSVSLVRRRVKPFPAKKHMTGKPDRKEEHYEEIVLYESGSNGNAWRFRTNEKCHVQAAATGRVLSGLRNSGILDNREGLFLHSLQTQKRRRR